MYSREKRTKVNKIYMNMQAGDALRTYADVSDLESIEEGLSKFVEWYKEYYDIKF